MVYNIIVGRDRADREEFLDKGTINLGRQYVQMGQTISLSNNVFLDVNRPHVILVTGKRSSGKSYTLSVMAEEMMKLKEDIKKNLSFLFFDTMGIFWTMRYPNMRQEDLLKKWDLKPEKFDVKIFTPKGFFDEYKERGISNNSFSIKTSELSAEDWMQVFNISPVDEEGIMIVKIISEINYYDYSIQEIITKIRNSKAEQKIKDILENKFSTAEKWGLFDEDGTKINDLVKPGEVSIVDISCYTDTSSNWNVKALVIGLISRRLLNERISLRKYEELNEINKIIADKEDLPLVWILIDEAHNFLMKEGKTPATDALVQLLREGRQPGISLVLATQQPGEIHKDVLTQSDIVISHRLTSKVDIDALNSVMQKYLIQDLQRYLNELPREKGSAIVLDDNSERIYPIAIHPKRSWHGGEAPKAIRDIKIKEEIF